MSDIEDKDLNDALKRAEEMFNRVHEDIKEMNRLTDDTWSKAKTLLPEDAISYYLSTYDEFAGLEAECESIIQYTDLLFKDHANALEKLGLIDKYIGLVTGMRKLQIRNKALGEYVYHRSELLVSQEVKKLNKSMYVISLIVLVFTIVSIIK